MPPSRLHFRRRRQTVASNSDAPELFRLWLLRLLVPLGAHREFIKPHGFNSEELAEVLGLGRWIDGDNEAGLDPWDEAEVCDPHDRGAPAQLESYQPKRVRTELRRLHRNAERKTSASQLPPSLRSNLDRLATLVGLSAVDVRILEFAVMIHSDGLLVETAEWLGQLSTVKLIHALSVVLDLPDEQVREALAARGVLARSGLVTCLRNGADTLSSKLDLLSTYFADQILSGEMDPVELLRDNVAPCPPPELSLADYTHIEPSLSVLLPYLQHALESRRTGVNIFLYGQPGTGKTQLARVLTASLGCALFQVASEDDDGDAVTADRRLRAFRAAQSILARRQVLIAFDEAEDVFDDGNAFFGRKSTAQTHKAWINRTLEENPVPTLWLSNDISSLDPAFVRRFDMVIELPIPPRQQRERILSAVCGDVLAPRAIARIAESEVLAPAVAARAAAVVRSIQSRLGTPASGEALERLIGNTLQAQGHPAILRDDPNRLPETYDPAFLNADADLAALADGLARHRQARLCLYGPSGTGKSAYARWLSQRLGMPLHVRRGSDLMSKWLGESEKNLASAFRQAEQDKALLLIDEVDGFLHDRRDAEHSWEVTQVNEMLTQMESFSGVFVASTNLMQGLEPAALRRFDLQVRFDFLKPEQAWALFLRQSAALGLAEPGPELRPRLDRLGKLTPGDFAAAARQHRFSPMASAAMLLSMLTATCTLKDGGRTVIGFL
jgi:transitional endoplasmic reticulum ATPase